MSHYPVNLSPVYQRRDRWDDVRQSLLIESFLMNVPVPPIFLNEDEYGKYSVIDGRQRLTAIHSFISNNLSLRGLQVFGDIDGLTFRQLPARFQAVIKTRPTLRAVIILRQSDPDIKYQVFRRLNTGGVTLNAQEIRNSVFPGSLNMELTRLSESKQFHNLLGIRSRKRSKLYREMGDVELVLRFFAFRETWHDFAGGITRHLDTYMENNKDMEKARIDEAKDDFLKTLDIVDMVFSQGAYRRWIPETGKWRNQVLAALFDAQMLSFREFSIEQIEPHSNRILERFKKLFENDEFQRAIGASISVYFKLRINMVRDIIRETI